MSGSVSPASTNVRHDAARLHPLRRTESDRDLAYLIRTLLRFSGNENAGSARRLHRRAASREKPGSAQSAPTVPAAGLERLHTSSRRIRAASGDVHAAAIVARSTRGTGRKPYPRCLVSGSSDRTVQLWDWPPPVQSAPRRLVTPTSSSRWGSVLAEPSSHAAGISPCGCGTCHSLSSCCPGSADLRAGPAGSSYLTETTQICFQAPRPPLPVRLLVNRCCSRRSSGDAHGPCLRLPLHCHEPEIADTEEVSGSIQYRPPARHLVSGTFAGLRTPCYQGATNWQSVAQDWSHDQLTAPRIDTSPRRSQAAGAAREHEQRSRLTLRTRTGTSMPQEAPCSNHLPSPWPPAESPSRIN
jgi:hypothetical protein